MRLARSLWCEGVLASPGVILELSHRKSVARC